jgi:uncharacterized protein YbjT (DUF2867 family)
MVSGNLTAVVFGGGGFIGRHFIRRLAKTGAVVRVPSRHVSRVGFLRTAGVVGQIVPEIMSTFDDAELAGAIEGADLVVSLIGILSENNKGAFDRIHTDLQARIAREATAAGVKRLVHVSALGASPDSKSAYARSKAAGEAAMREFFPEVTILRPSIVFGPEDQFFNRFAAIAGMSPVLPLIGGGLTRFQPVYVGDVADAIMATLSRPEAKGQTYELGGPIVYTFKELMELLLQEIGLKRLLAPVPWGVARMQAGFAEMLPSKPLTRDQVELLKQDNVLSGTLPGLSDLGVQPTAAELILPTYLDRFRKGGRFGQGNRAYR